MKEYPASPGAPASILHREMHTNDEKSFETRYYRIKIFTEEGRKYANVQIPYFKGKIRVKNIKARTVHPDGAIVTFTGGVFEKVIVKRKKLKLLVKTFTLPNVRVGSIIEYKYRIQWGSRLLLPTEWDIGHELFTRRVRFSLRPYIPHRLSASSPRIMLLPFRLPTGKGPRYERLEKYRGGKGPSLAYQFAYQMELEDIPAFQEEQYIPPENELKMWVLFYYLSRSFYPSFWQQTGRDLYEEVEKFIGKHKAIKQEVARIVRPDDPPETKLRKLYARVQQIRNLRYDRKNIKRDKKPKKNKNVKDVLKRGYAHPLEINRLLVALARAAGFDASVVRVASRTNSFFKTQLLDDSQLNVNLVLVGVGGKEYYLDPATRFCPFGFLSWDQTMVQGIRLAEDGGEFVKTPNPGSADAHTGRKAVLHLGEDGSLHGKVELTFTGQEALQQRLDALKTDEAGARKELED